jgi:hypothetical protein
MDAPIEASVHRWREKIPINLAWVNSQPELDVC